MNSPAKWVLFSCISVAGAWMPQTSHAQFTEVKDIDLSPPVMYSRAYAPDRKAFEACWKSIPQDKTFDASSKLELGDTVFFRYASGPHHFRSIVSKVSPRTFVSLTHFDERDHKGDLLAEMSQSQELTLEQLRRYLEYLPLGAETGLLTDGYPLTPTGTANHEIMLRDLEPAAHRIYLPSSSLDEPASQAGDPPPDEHALAKERELFQEALNSGRLVNFWEWTATNGLYALPRAYCPNKEVFDALWKNRSVINGLKKSEVLETFCEPSIVIPDPLAYQASAGHHRAILVRDGRIHYFMIVRFSDPAKDDLAIYLGFPYEHRNLLAQRLAHAAEYLPYCLNVDPQHKGYVIQKNGWLDAKVVWRDFYSIPSRPYSGAKPLFPEPRVLTAAEKAHRYLSDEEAEKLARQLCEVPVTDCQESDVSFEGLVKVANRNLQAAHRLEKVQLAFPDSHQDAEAREFEQIIKTSNPWGSYSKAQGKLDRKKLAEEINRGSVYDLVNNITLWFCNGTGCFSDGIFILGGENWPHLPDKKDYYPLIFR